MFARIEDRLDGVGYLVEDAGPARRHSDLLRRAPDMERALSRLALGRGGPRDLAAVRAGLEAAQALRRLLGGSSPADALGLAQDRWVTTYWCGSVARARPRLPLAPADGGSSRAAILPISMNRRAAR